MSSRIKKILRFFFIFVALLLLIPTYIVVVPPPASADKPARPEIKKVAPQDNAWLEYEQAIKEMDNETLPKDFESDQGVPLTDQIKALLDKHASAFEHIKAGVKRSKFQFITEPPNAASPLPNLLNFLKLTKLAMAQSQRLASEKKYDNAIELALALHHMSTDLAEPYSMLIMAMTSLSGRKTAKKELFQLFNDADLSAENLAQIARDLAFDDDRMPPPADLIQWESDIFDRSIEDMLINKQDAFGIINNSTDRLLYFKNVRLRVYNSSLELHQQMMATMKPSLQSWDLAGLNEANKKIDELVKEKGKFFSHPFIGDAVASILMDMARPNMTNALKLLYLDRANSAALRALAISKSFQKKHGQYPEKLATACAEANLAIPIDPATTKPAGYRIENGKPLIWLAGFDRQDDGGKKAYESNDITPGADLIYIAGEFPAVFKF
jgi:hypothetical protein